jgi:SAM-dependent methyltransferase
MAEKVGINCGSGQRRFNSTPEVEWINVDKISRPGEEPDLVCDGSQLPYLNASVDYFVLVQTLEHFGCGEGAGLVKEAHRVLRPGGSLLLSVPNMHELCFEWLHGQRLNTQLFMTNVYGAFRGDEESRHKWGFDSPSLLNFLSANGPWKSCLIQRSPDLPGSSFPHDWWILEAECVR